MSTSMEALIDHELSGRAESHREHCLSMVRRFPGKTAVELWAADKRMARHEYSRRLPELVSLGVVRRGDIRRCNVRGSKMLTWWPVNTEGVK